MSQCPWLWSSGHGTAARPFPGPAQWSRSRPRHTHRRSLRRRFAGRPVAPAAPDLSWMRARVLRSARRVPADRLDLRCRRFTCRGCRRPHRASPTGGWHRTRTGSRGRRSRRESSRSWSPPPWLRGSRSILCRSLQRNGHRQAADAHAREQVPHGLLLCSQQPSRVAPAAPAAAARGTGPERCRAIPAAGREHVSQDGWTTSRRCVSRTAPVAAHPATTLQRQLRERARLCQLLGIQLVLGGRGAWPEPPPGVILVRSRGEFHQRLSAPGGRPERPVPGAPPGGKRTPGRSGP
jgi:hypothetical protein